MALTVCKYKFLRCLINGSDSRGSVLSSPARIPEHLAQEKPDHSALVISCDLLNTHILHIF